MKLPNPYRLRRFAGSLALFGLAAAMFLVELARGAVGNDERQLALGALPDSGGLHGQYWRLLTFGFLHSNFVHLLLNLVLLLLAGPAVERRAGSRRVLLVFLGASVASGVGILAKHQLWPASGVSVGASGGMFGLLAAGLALVFREERPNALARTALSIALVLGLAYSLLPGVSMVGHVVGIAVGAVIALIVPRRQG